MGSMRLESAAHVPVPWTFGIFNVRMTWRGLYSRPGQSIQFETHTCHARRATSEQALARFPT